MCKTTRLLSITFDWLLGFKKYRKCFAFITQPVRFCVSLGWDSWWMICDTLVSRFRPRYCDTASFYLSKIVSCNIISRVFHPIPKYPVVGWKNEAYLSLFDKVLSVWKSNETLFWVVTIPFQTILLVLNDSLWNSKQKSYKCSHLQTFKVGIFLVFC